MNPRPSHITLHAYINGEPEELDVAVSEILSFTADNTGSYVRFNPNTIAGHFCSATETPADIRALMRGELLPEKVEATE